ncbi:MAG TPA: hypothetical protein VJS47_09395 [Rhizomicrobium sp.]|nr:hypothetical protein [Rhizomicrobium sp.]
MKWQKSVLILLLVAGILPANGAVLPGLSMNQLRALSPQERVRQAVDLVTELLAFRAQRAAQAPALDPTGSNALLISQLKKSVMFDGAAPDDINTPEARSRLAANLRLVDTPPLTADPPKRLRALSLKTRWHATAVDGLCEKTGVGVMLVPIGGAQGPDAPVKPSTVFVYNEFHALLPPATASMPEATAAQRVRTDAQCLQLEGQDIRTDVAPDPEQALRMRWLLSSAVNGLAQETPPFTLDCNRMGGICKNLISDSVANGYQTFACKSDAPDCEVRDNKNFRKLHIVAGPGPNPAISTIKLEISVTVMAPPDRSND